MIAERITERDPNVKNDIADEPLLNNTMFKESTFRHKNARYRYSDSRGLCNFRAFFFLILWYIFSGCTLFLNKYILSYMNGDPTVLGKFTIG